MTGSLTYILVKVNFKGKPLHSYSFPNRDITIGRSAECDIVLDNAGVSRQHAMLACVEGEIEVTDLDSGNGTFVNDQSVQQMFLSANDRLRIGKFDLDVMLSSEPGETSSIEAKSEDEESSQTVFLSQEERKQILQETPAEQPTKAKTWSPAQTLAKTKKSNIPWGYVLIGAVGGFLLRSFFELF